MKIHIRIACLVSLTLLMPGWLLSTALAQVELKHFSITQGRLVFAYQSRPNRPSDLFVANFESLEVKNLTTSPYSESHPRWSPDGRWVVFDANKDGNRDIFLISWDGTLLKQLTKTPTNEEAPDWSPDGRHIVFYRKGDRAKKFLYKINPDGSGETPLASSLQNASMPRWSPRGDEVLFSTDKYWPGWDIGVVRIENGEQFPVSVGKRSYARATWSPDGSSITFGYGSGDDFDIYTVEKGSKNPTKTASREGRDTDPEWTPDGKHLFFSSEVVKGERNYQVYVLNTASKEIHQVTASKGTIRFPSYTPHPTIEKFAPNGAKISRPQRYFETPEDAQETGEEDEAASNNQESNIPSRTGGSRIIINRGN